MASSAPKTMSESRARRRKRSTARSGLDWIPPELRENQGEIELAEANALPVLIERGDIRGDLHMHTTATDGRATLEEMAAAARALGYEYVAITDHSKAIAMAFGLDEKRVVDFAQTVRKINESGDLGIRILSGLECDIMKDGEMDIAWDALAELDIVIGSVHSHMDLEPDAMTDRLLRALECPHLTGPRTSDRQTASASRPVHVRLRSCDFRSCPPRRVARSEFKPGAARPEREPRARGEGKGREVHRFD